MVALLLGVSFTSAFLIAAPMPILVGPGPAPPHTHMIVRVDPSSMMLALCTHVVTVTYVNDHGEWTNEWERTWGISVMARASQMILKGASGVKRCQKLCSSRLAHPSKPPLSRRSFSRPALSMSLPCSYIFNAPETCTESIHVLKFVPPPNDISYRLQVTYVSPNQRAAAAAAVHVTTARRRS